MKQAIVGGFCLLMTVVLILEYCTLFKDQKVADPSTQNAVFAEENLGDVLNTTEKMFGENSRIEILNYLHKKTVSLMVQTNEVLSHYLSIANRIPCNPRSELQLDLPHELFEAQLQQTSLASNIISAENFIMLSNEENVAVMSTPLAPLGKWSAFRYPYVTNGAIVFYRPVNENDSTTPSIETVCTGTRFFDVYSKSASPVVLVIVTRDNSVKDAGFDCYKIEKHGENRLIPITREESDALQSQYFSTDNQGFYGTFESKGYMFYGLPKLERVDELSLNSLFEKWRNGKITRIEYMPFDNGNSSYEQKYSLIKTDGGERIFWYWSKDGERCEYALLNTQWRDILAVTKFREIRFFFDSSTDMRAVSFRCDIDWSNTNQVNNYIVNRIPW